MSFTWRATQSRYSKERKGSVDVEVIVYAYEDDDGNLKIGSIRDVPKDELPTENVHSAGGKADG